MSRTSQSDVELECTRRADQIHRSIQLTNCSPSVIHSSLSPSLSLVTFLLLARVDSSSSGRKGLGDGRRRREAVSTRNRASTENRVPSSLYFCIHSSALARSRQPSNLISKDSRNDPLDRRNGHVYWSLGSRIDAL